MAVSLVTGDGNKTARPRKWSFIVSSFLKAFTHLRFRNVRPCKPARGRAADGHGRSRRSFLEKLKILRLEIFEVLIVNSNFVVFFICKLAADRWTDNHKRVKKCACTHTRAHTNKTYRPLAFEVTRVHDCRFLSHASSSNKCNNDSCAKITGLRRSRGRTVEEESL